MSVANLRSSWDELVNTVQKVRAERDPELPEKLVERILRLEVVFLGAVSNSDGGRDAIQADTLRQLNSVVDEYLEDGDA